MLARFCRGSKKEDFIKDVVLDFIPRVGEVVMLFLDDGPHRFKVYSVEHFFKPNHIGEITHTIGIVVDPLGA